ncbi:MAG: HAD family hydrolase [Erysipelotrichaceae bacterium]|nr:HAD family hydrolase [Erysipelotrichaceae bacterium]
MKTIFFDLDDTLYYRSDPFSKACGQMFGITDEAVLQKAFERVDYHGSGVFYQHEQGRITAEQMYIYRYVNGFADIGICLTDREALDFYECYQYHLDHLVLSGKAAEVLDLCSSLFKEIGIITNGPSDHQRSKIKALQLDRWVKPEMIFISSETGSAKPDKGIFLTAQDISCQDAENLVMCGDSYKNDIAPVLELNWKTIYLNKRAFENPDADKADYCALRIEQLREILPLAAK